MPRSHLAPLLRLARLWPLLFAGQPSPTLDLGDTAAVETLMHRFLRTVDETWFPLHPAWEWWEETEELMPWLWEIPVHPVGFDTCNTWPDEHDAATALVMRLASIGRGSPTMADPYRAALAQCYPKWQIPADFDLLALLPVLEEQMTLPTPLDGLPALIRMATHSTDTFFLDACPGCMSYQGDEFTWRAETLRWLRDDWQRAEPIFDRALSLSQWVEEQPARIEQVWDVLRRAHVYEQFADEYGYQRAASAPPEEEQ